MHIPLYYFLYHITNIKFSVFTLSIIYVKLFLYNSLEISYNIVMLFHYFGCILFEFAVGENCYSFYDNRIIHTYLFSVILCFLLKMNTSHLCYIQFSFAVLHLTPISTCLIFGTFLGLQFSVPRTQNIESEYFYHCFYKECDKVTVLHEQFYKTKQNDFPHLIPSEFIYQSI